MKILKYFYQDTDKPGWKFSELEFSNINLLVGDTATGKTRFMNTFYNLCLFITQKASTVGEWKVTFEHQSFTYTLEIKSIPGDKPNKPAKIVKDCLWRHDKSQNEPLFKRIGDRLMFDGRKTPTLSSEIPGISLFKEEPSINPVYDAFGLYLRRTFGVDYPIDVLLLSGILPQHIIKESLPEDQLLDQIFHLHAPLNINLYLLKKHCYKTYKELTTKFRKIFPFISKMQITDISKITNITLPGKVPVFCVQEVNSDSWAPQVELSSGMQKVLLILTDMYILPSGSVYLLDEYENSLGISTIDFFPEVVYSMEKEIQFLISSHHPYLINEIPVKNWFVFHRDGLNVEVRYGKVLTEKYGKSKQQAFLQLINDPFYSRK